RETAPPHIGLGKGADSGAGEAASPVSVDVRPELVAGQPVDLVLLDAVEHDLVAERDAVGGTADGAFPADLAEILDADVDGLVWHQRKIGHDRIWHVDASSERLVDEEPVSPELADAGRQPGGLRVRDTPERRVSELLDVALQGFEDHGRLDL